MKKNIFLFAFFTISLFSCSKSDSEPISKSSIIGKWQLVSATKNGINVPLSICEKEFGYLEFFPDNTLIFNEGYTSGGTECRNYKYNETYILVDDVLTMREEKENYLNKSFSKVVELNSNVLKIKTYYSMEIYNGVVSENTVPENEQVTVTLNKIK